MRKILRHYASAAASVLVAAVFTTGAYAIAPKPVKIVGTPDNFTELYAPAVDDMSKPMVKAPGQTHTVTLNVETAGQEAYILKICAATEVDGEIFWENAEMISNTTFEFNLPDGTYDILGFFYTDNILSGTMLSESVTVSGQDEQVVLNLADATIITDLVPMDTEGNILPYADGEDDNIVVRYGVMSFITYKGVELVLLENYAQDLRWFKSNTNASPYNITVVSRTVCSGDIGMLYAIIPIDFNKQVNSASSSNWQSASVTFQPTPFNIKYVPEGNDFYGYAITRASFLAGGLWYYTAGQGSEGGCDTGKVNIWVPENYNGFVDVVVYPTGYCVGSADAGIKGMALKRTESGLTQIGQNVYFGRNLFANPYNQDLVVGGNPLYQFNPDGMKLGNCAPTLINYQATWTMFDYQFTGRMGEELSIDSFDISDRTSNIDEYGGKCTSSVLITCNGKTICDNRFNFDPENDGPEGKYHVEISTDNVLVDGEVAGYNKTVFEYETDDMGQSPTIAGLQFRDKEDIITDHFESAADGRMILYATQFMADYDEETDDMWYRAISVENITVEAAPYNSEDYFEIPVVTDPQKDYELGWGQYFEGSLEGVETRSDNGWFKLRIKMVGVNGGWQEQIICPAFKIESLNNGVKSVEAERSPLNFQINGDNIIAPGARIYDLNGVEIDGKNLSSGLYIITDGSKTAKALVR